MVARIRHSRTTRRHEREGRGRRRGSEEERRERRTNDENHVLLQDENAVASGESALYTWNVRKMVRFSRKKGLTVKRLFPFFEELLLAPRERSSVRYDYRHLFGFDPDASWSCFNSDV